MKFCSKCKTLLVPSEEGLICPSCGYKESAKLEVKEAINKKKVVKKEDKEEIQTAMLPIVKAKCPKCGNEEAYWYSKQTRATDEPETQFFICKKCGYRWRKY
ncbi:MAG: transcription factor S [Candidatus Nanoarchaeia archaeon]